MRWINWIAALAAVTLGACAPAMAADVKFSALSVASTLTGNERMISVQGTGCAAGTVPCSNVVITPVQIVTYADGTIGTTIGRSILNAASAGTIRTTIGAAASGTNSDINVLSGLTTPLSVGQGGTGGTSASAARTALGAAASGANTDITSITGSAAQWTTARTLSMTGDVSWSLSLDGSSNVTGSATLAAVNANIGGFGGATAVPVLTVDAKGRVTAITTAAISYLVPSSNFSEITNPSLARSNIGAAGTANVQVFNTSGTWTNSATCRMNATG